MENWENLGDRTNPNGKTASVGQLDTAIIAMRNKVIVAGENHLNRILQIRPHIPGDEEPEVSRWHLLDSKGTGFALIHRSVKGWIFQNNSTKTERSFGETLTLGRDDIPLVTWQKPYVSQYHFTITMESSDEGDKLVIADAESTNGTWVKVTKSV